MTGAEAARAPEVAAAPPPETPYVGLVPYTEDDSAYFFGRDSEKRIVTANLRAARLTLVYGASGVGKTSLLQAGVVHDLREQLAGGARRPGGRAPFAIAVFRGWRDDPLLGLMEAVRVSVQQASPGLELEPWLPGASAVATLRGWTEHAMRLLVVLDQFEDYFLYHPPEEGEDTFGTQFAEIVNEPNLRVHFVVSFREDAWSSLDRFKGRIPQLFANYVRVEHLTRAGARAAIVGPVDEYNTRLPDGAERYGVDQDLIDAVLDAATAAPEGANGAAPAGEGIETPFLQLVMEKLWNVTVGEGGHALTKATLGRVGGARRIVETHLVDALGKLTLAEQEIAAGAFRYLVTRSRRRVVQSLSDLSEWLGRPEAEVGAVLEKLTSGESGRILRPVPPPPGRTDEGARYELFHDVLADPILEWRRDFVAERERAEAEREREAERQRQRKRQRRLIAVVVGLAVLVAVFAALAVVAYTQNRRAQHERSNALASRAIRELAVDPLSALVLAMHAIKAWSGGPDAQSALRSALRTSADVQAVLRGHTDQVERASFSPDGRLVVTASDDGTVRIWDATTGRSLHVLRARGGAVFDARFTADGKHVATGSADGTVHIWSSAGTSQASRQFDNSSFGPEFSADGKLALVGDRVGRLHVLAVPSLGPVATLPPVTNAALWSVAVAPGDARVLTAYADGTARIWNRRSRRPLPGVLKGPAETVTAAAFSSDGKRVVLAYDPSDVATIWDVATRKRLLTLRGHTQRIESVQFSSDGRYVLTAGDTTARLWDAATGRNVAVLRHQGDFVLYAAFSPDGRRVVTSGADTTARVWEVRARGGEVILSGHRDRVYDAAFSPDGRTVVTASRDHTARIWNALTGDPVRTLRQSRDVLAATYLRGGQGIVTAGLDGVTTYGRDGIRRVTPVPARDVDVRADGTFLVTGTDGIVRIGRPPARAWRSLDAEGVLTAVFSTDGSKILAAGGSGVEIWDADTLKLLRRLSYEPGILYSASFSADGKRIATASADGTARIFDATNGHQERVFTVPATVTSARFSPDGGLLVASSRDGTVRVWDASSGALRAIFTDHTDVVWNASFSPDGKRVLSASSDGTARIYPLTPIGELLDLARARLRASVTPRLEQAILAQP